MMQMSSAMPAILVYAQELLPGKVGMISGLFFGFAFGMAGIAAAVLGKLADRTGIEFVYQVCAFLPAIGLLTGLLPAIAGAIIYFTPSHKVVYWLLYANPVYACVLSFDDFYKGSAERFWWSITVTQVMTWILVALASVLVPYSWQDTASARGKRSWGERWEAWSFGRGEARRKFRTRLLRINPFFWLASRSRTPH